MPKKLPQKIYDCAVRMATEGLGEYPSKWVAAKVLASMLEVDPETFCKPLASGQMSWVWRP